MTSTQIITRDYYEMSPVEEIGGVLWKRDDKFAPLGYGSLNGSKLRQCLWLVERARKAGAKGIVSAASVVSPQLAMSTWAAAGQGMDSLQIIGATKPHTAINYPSVAIAAMLGARFHIAPVAYNPYLQAPAKRILAKRPDLALIEYGISLDHKSHSPEDIKGFHDVGAHQATNLPEGIERLIIPSGSCNTLVSILLGLAYGAPRSLKEVMLFVIGPSKLSWAWDRLRVIDGIRPGVLKALERFSFPIHDLHRSRFASYGDRMPERYGGIVFHPNYEGKILRYIRKMGLDVLREGTCFWVVGSEPSASITANALGMAMPKEITLTRVEAA